MKSILLINFLFNLALIVSAKSVDKSTEKSIIVVKSVTNDKVPISSTEAAVEIKYCNIKEKNAKIKAGEHLVLPNDCEIVKCDSNAEYKIEKSLENCTSVNVTTQNVLDSRSQNFTASPNELIESSTSSIDKINFNFNSRSQNFTTTPKEPFENSIKTINITYRNKSNYNVTPTDFRTQNFTISPDQQVQNSTSRIDKKYRNESSYEVTTTDVQKSTSRIDKNYKNESNYETISTDFRLQNFTTTLDETTENSTNRTDKKYKNQLYFETSTIDYSLLIVANRGAQLPIIGPNDEI